MAAVPLHCPLCGMTRFATIPHICNKFTGLPHTALRHLAGISGIEGEGRMTGVSVGMAPALARAGLNLDALHVTLRENHYATQPPTQRPNFRAEGIVAQKLFRLDPASFRIWETLAEADKNVFRQKIKDERGNIGEQCTPDFIFKGRIVDVVSAKVSTGRPFSGTRTEQQEKDHANGQHTYSLAAINTSLIPNVAAKWNKYGATSIAVANISMFAKTITTEFVSVRLLSEPKIADRLAAGNALYLFRDEILLEVTLPPTAKPVDPQVPFPLNGSSSTVAPVPASPAVATAM